MTAFTDAIESIPFHTTTPEATGITAPIFRASGHILYATARLASTEGEDIGEEIKNELLHASEHLSAANQALATLTSQNISLGFTNHIINFIHATTAAADEFLGWSADDRLQNLKNLANRAAALAAEMDTEFIGIRSDPGSSL